MSCFIYYRYLTTFSFRSHEIALRQGLLAGYKVHVTKKVKPEPSQMKGTVSQRFLLPRALDEKFEEKITVQPLLSIATFE